MYARPALVSTSNHSICSALDRPPAPSGARRLRDATAGRLAWKRWCGALQAVHRVGCCSVDIKPRPRPPLDLAFFVPTMIIILSRKSQNPAATNANNHNTIIIFSSSSSSHGVTPATRPHVHQRVAPTATTDTNGVRPSIPIPVQLRSHLHSQSAGPTVSHAQLHGRRGDPAARDGLVQPLHIRVVRAAGPVLPAGHAHHAHVRFALRLLLQHQKHRAGDRQGRCCLLGRVNVTPECQPTAMKAEVKAEVEAETKDEPTIKTEPLFE